MKFYCDYHPTRLSHWLCPKCHKSFCRDCISERQGGYSGKETFHFCPSCNQQAEWIGASNTTIPFWNRIPKFFLYPLNIQPLLLIIILAILAALFTRPGLFNWLVRFAIWGVMLKYSFFALRRTATGDLTPPLINSESISSDFEIVFKQLVLFFLCGAALLKVMIMFGPLGGLLFYLVGLFFIPSMIIILVATESVLHAVNPLVFVPLVTRIGKGYIIMYFFLTILYGAPYVLLSFTIPFMPRFTHSFLFYGINNFYTLVAYHLMGYVLLQYHQEVGYKINYDEFTDPSDSKPAVKSDPADKNLEQVGILIKEGKHDEAIRYIEEVTSGSGFSDVEFSSRYYTLLKMKNDTEKLGAHAPGHLEMLVRNSRLADADEVYETCKKDFLPAPLSLFKIAAWQNSNGKSQEAVSSFKRFIKSFPDHPSVPTAYFRIAQIYHDRLMESEKAKKILTYILKQYPHHDIESQTRNYLKQMA